MLEILKYILFRSVLIIITLHTLIPHPHSDVLTDEDHFEIHQKSNSLIGIIRLVFHENNDENLDNFVYAQCENAKRSGVKNQKSNISITKGTSFKIEQKKIEIIENFSVVDFNKTLFVKLNGLRGPPLLT